MQAYASSTGTKRNLLALRSAGWRLIFTPFSHETPTHSYALDNGAWSAFRAGRKFDVDAFLRMCDRSLDGADWVVVPDIVQGGLRSLEFSLGWLDRISGPRLIAVQDGMTQDDLNGVVGGDIGIFIGGSSEWKEQTALAWGELAKSANCYLHMGRVNSQRRIKIAAASGCDSFDGSSVTRYAVTLSRLDGARRQLCL